MLDILRYGNISRVYLLPFTCFISILLNSWYCIIRKYQPLKKKLYAFIFILFFIEIILLYKNNRIPQKNMNYSYLNSISFICLFAYFLLFDQLFHFNHWRITIFTYNFHINCVMSILLYWIIEIAIVTNLWTINYRYYLLLFIFVFTLVVHIYWTTIYIYNFED